MALLEAIGGFFAKGITALGTKISTSAAAAKIGTVARKVATGIVNIVSGIPKIDGDKMVKIVDIASKIIDSVSAFMGIRTRDDAEILGMKADQAEKTLNDFDNDTVAYIKYLQEEIELDKEKINEMSVEERLGYKVLGTALEMGAIEEKMQGVELSPEFIVTLAKIQYGGNIVIGAKEFTEVVQMLKELGITNMKDVSQYLEGNGSCDTVRIGEALQTTIEKVYGVPDASKEILGAMKIVRNFEVNQETGDN